MLEEKSKYQIVIYFTVLFLGTLFFTACDSASDPYLSKFLGEGEHWKAELILRSAPSENYHVSDIYLTYLGDFSDVEEKSIIHYSFNWLHREAEFSDDSWEVNSIVFHGDDSEPVVAMIGRGGGLRIDVERKIFIDEQRFYEINLSEFADYIIITLEWNDQEEMFDLKKEEESYHNGA